MEVDSDPSELNRRLYSSNSNSRKELQITDEHIFLWLNTESIVRINEVTQSLAPVAQPASGDRISSQTSVFNHGLYYTSNNGYGGGVFKLFMLDNNLEITELFSNNYESMNFSSYFFQKAGENIFFYLENEGQYLFYKLNTQTNTVDEILAYPTSSDMIVHGVSENGVVISTRGSMGRRIVELINANGDIINMAFQPLEGVTWVPSSDQENYYFTYSFENNIDSVFRFNIQSEENNFFSTSTFDALYFRGNNRIFVKRFGTVSIGEINNDTLELVNHLVPVSTVYDQNIGNFYRPRIIDNEDGLFTFSTKEIGFELFKINEEDTLDFFVDLNKGRGHGIPMGSCNQMNNPPTDRLLAYEDRKFLNMTNGNDGDVYLYEILEDSLQSKLLLKDYNPNAIRFFTFNDYLYYFVLDLSSDKNRLYRIEWSEMDDVQPPSISFDSQTWSTETSSIGENQHCQSQGGNYIEPYGIDQDGKNNIIVSQNIRNYFSQYDGFDRKNNLFFKDSLSTSFFKYSPYGQISWVNSIGNKYKSPFSSSDKFIVDKNNNVQVYGTFQKKAYFDNDSLETIGSARFYAKLDGETGAVLNKKVLFQTDYLTSVVVDHIILGEDEYFYVTGSYRNFSQNFGDTTLISSMNRQNFLGKYDNNGNLFWIRNVNNNWSDSHGEINSIDFVEESDELLIFCTQTHFSCSNTSWKNSELIIYDLEGKEKLRKGFKAKYRHLTGGAIALDDQYYLIKGAVNEGVEAGVYESFVSEKSCDEYHDYQLIYDRYQNKFISAVISESNQGMMVKRILQDSDYFYLFGKKSSDGGNLIIQRLDKEGRYQGEKVINQNVDIRLSDITYRDGYFTIAMRDAEADSFLQIRPIFNDVVNTLNISRFQVTQWDYLQTFEPMKVKFITEESNLFAYPNPTFSSVQINFVNENDIFNHYSVIDISGKVLYQEKVPDLNFVQIDLSTYQNGIYFIRFEGEEENEVVKVVKQP
jgi:hypothetical protein